MSGPDGLDAADGAENAQMGAGTDRAHDAIGAPSWWHDCGGGKLCTEHSEVHKTAADAPELQQMRVLTKVFQHSMRRPSPDRELLRQIPDFTGQGCARVVLFRRLMLQ